MNSLEQLEKQQVGLRLPKYLVDDIDEFTKEFSLNRTDIIVEAIRSYIERQKSNKLYENFDMACKELKDRDKHSHQTLDGLIDELDNS
ncbi:MAG TPA: hypothetical protein EYG95_05740 [Campylobacterales bacterium]|nr:hypothetical protein [Campylobacterales bacterium]